MIKVKQAFTLVELIVVITILAMLGTIAFLSFQGYSRDARDSVRISDLNNISRGMEFMLTKTGRLPVPEDSVEITASGTIISYQGFAGENVLSFIGVNSGGKDPKDDEFYTYVSNANYTKYQLLGFLENGDQIGLGKLNQVNADLSERFPVTEGFELGVITDSLTIEPIQLTGTGFDLVTSTGVFNVYFQSYLITGTGGELGEIIPNQSCKRILELNNKSKSGLYNIDPNGLGESHNVYCDMITDGGGWTLVHKTTSNQQDLSGIMTLSEGLPNWDTNNEYRLSINYWKNLSTEKAMAINERIDGVKWNDITEGHLTSISRTGISFTNDDPYRIFNRGVSDGEGVNTCTSGTEYWNEGCCSRCVNFNGESEYGLPINAPMLRDSYTSYTGSAYEGAGGIWDGGRHRIDKMGIFLK